MNAHRITSADPVGPALSERQLTCLSLAAEGLTSKEIARRLHLSPSTVDNHIRTASARLGVRGRREAMRLMAHEPAGQPANDANPAEPLHDGQWPLSLPPLGGKRNTMSSFARLTSVIQIALLGTMALAAMIFTISGVVQVLSR